MLSWDDPQAYAARDDGLVIRAAALATLTLGPRVGPALGDAMQGVVSLRKTFDFCIVTGTAPTHWPEHQVWSAEKLACALLDGYPGLRL